MNTLRRLKRRSMRDSSSISKEIEAFNDERRFSSPSSHNISVSSFGRDDMPISAQAKEETENPYYYLNKIVCEIIDTEKDYVQYLQTMIEVKYV